MTTARLRSDAAWEFRLVYVLGFLYFLFIALVLRFMPQTQRPAMLAQNARRSVLGDAKAMAGTFIPFAFTR